MRGELAPSDVGPYTDELLAAKKLGRLAAKLLSHPVDRIGE